MCWNGGGAKGRREFPRTHWKLETPPFPSQGGAIYLFQGQVKAGGRRSPLSEAVPEVSELLLYARRGDGNDLHLCHQIVGEECAAESSGRPRLNAVAPRGVPVHPRCQGSLLGEVRFQRRQGIPQCPHDPAWPHQGWSLLADDHLPLRPQPLPNPPLLHSLILAHHDGIPPSWSRSHTSYPCPYWLRSLRTSTPHHLLASWIL